MPGRPRTASIQLHEKPLPAWLALWLPVMTAAYPLLLAVPGLDWEAGLNREQGLLENLTAALLLAALALLLRSARDANDEAHRAWLLALAAGTFFFMGEELSWGQHYFGWETPQPLLAMNRQGETNLHNLRGGLGSLLGHGCSAALSLLVAVGGLGGLCAAWPGLHLPRSLPTWFWPPVGCAPAAVLSVAVRLPRLLAGSETLPVYYGTAMGELKECLQALFILLYALAQKQRMDGLSAPAPGP